MDRPDAFDSISISLASPDAVRRASCGEVLKPETINYRTYLSEPGGLFCMRIFGPEVDWECACGKYRGPRFAGTVCDRCGVELAPASVRRRRMGHVQLVVPAVHPWFIRGSCPIGTLLGIPDESLERVVYYQDYLVLDPGATGLAPMQLLGEEELLEARDRFGDAFECDMGARAIRTALSRLPRRDGPDPAWTVLEAIPVVPPDLRPLVLLRSGNFATSDLNDLYRRLVNRNNRIRRLFELNAPEVILRNESRMLQQAVDALLDNARCRRPVLGSTNAPLKSLTDMLTGKQGRFRENLLAKRVDFSAHSFAVPCPDLEIHRCGLPRRIAIELFRPFVVRHLLSTGGAGTSGEAEAAVQARRPEALEALERVVSGHPVVLAFAERTDRARLLAFDPLLVDGAAIRVPPAVWSAVGADEVAVHLPLSIEAQVEAWTLLLASRASIDAATGRPLFVPSGEVLLGLHHLTAPGETPPDGVRAFSSVAEVLLALDAGAALPGDPIEIDAASILERRPVRTDGSTRIRTTVGRVLLNDALPRGVAFVDETLDAAGVGRLLDEARRRLGPAAVGPLLGDLSVLGFEVAARSGLSIGKDDLPIPTGRDDLLEATRRRVRELDPALDRRERSWRADEAWAEAARAVAGAALANLPPGSPLGRIHASGAADAAPLLGASRPDAGAPIASTLREGLGSHEWYRTVRGGRRRQLDGSGRDEEVVWQLLAALEDVVVAERDCGSTEGVVCRSLLGRTVLVDVVDPRTAVVMNSQIFVAFPDGDHWSLIPLAHLSAVEPIAKVRKKRNKSDT